MSNNLMHLSQMSEDVRYIIDFFESKLSNLESLIKVKERAESTIPDTMQPAEVCRRMGWSRSKFEQFKRDGLFRTFKIGGKVYVYTSDLRALFPQDSF